MANTLDAMKQENLVTNKLYQDRTLRDEYESKGASLASDFFCATKLLFPLLLPYLRHLILLCNSP